MRREFDDTPPIGSNALDTDAVTPLARGALARLATEARSVPVSKEFIDGFCRLLISDDARAAERVLGAMTAGRAGAAQLADGLLGAAARRLGEKWDTDAASFAEVSVAIARITRLRQVHAQRHVPIRAPSEGRRALFATLPGQAHNLGLVLAAEAFRQNEWDVTLLLDLPMAEIVDRARRIRPRAFGISISRQDRGHALRYLVSQIAGFPYRVRIVVGGAAASDFVSDLPPEWNVRAVADIETALAHA